MSIAQAVSRRLLTAEERVCAQVNICGIFGGQSGTGTVFSPCYQAIFLLTHTSIDQGQTSTSQ
jgi:hypothetical protein